jgi:hypothetical protein
MMNDAVQSERASRRREGDENREHDPRNHRRNRRF